MSIKFSKTPWWVKSIGITGMTVVGAYIKEELRYHFRGKKPHPDTENELDELEDMVNEVKQELSKSKMQAQQKQEILDSVPKPQSLSTILEHSKIEYSYLFGPWIWEGGCTVLFSPTKLGKTTCAVQIANDIACGTPSMMLPPELNQPHSPQAVLYNDLESDDTDFQDRYGMAPNEFSPNLQFTFDHVFDTSEELMDSIENNVFQFNGNVTVVIDNTSMIGDSKYQAKTEQLIKRIKALQTRFKQNGHLLTFILVAHTHKTIDDKIELEDISGSSNFANLSRSILAIEKSGFGNDYRILKPLSSRKKDVLEDDQVIVIKRCSDPYLHFEYFATMNEDDALAGNNPEQPESPKEKGKPGPKSDMYPMTIEQIRSMKDMIDAIGTPNQKLPTKKSIAEHFGIPASYIDRKLEILAKYEVAEIE